MVQLAKGRHSARKYSPKKPPRTMPKFINRFSLPTFDTPSEPTTPESLPIRVESNLTEDSEQPFQGSEGTVVSSPSLVIPVTVEMEEPLSSESVSNRESTGY